MDLTKMTTKFQHMKDRVVVPSSRTSYTVASAAKALQMGQALEAQVLIVDPPRKGLEDEVLEELCKQINPDQPSVDDATFLSMPEEKIHWTNDVQTLVYVSCGIDALARDCNRLLSSNGGWSLRSSTGYLLFPGSVHIETLAIFERK
jgi:tRNA/tmRNA/rRNA uracil-C5-methylase (TrmA/RlmC/RlmD family)